MEEEPWVEESLRLEMESGEMATQGRLARRLTSCRTFDNYSHEEFHALLKIFMEKKESSKLITEGASINGRTG